MSKRKKVVPDEDPVAQVGGAPVLAARVEAQPVVETPEQRRERMIALGRKGGTNKRGSRHKLQGEFIAALSNDFTRYGRSAIMRAREEDPVSYLRVIASLMPKEIELKRPLEDMPEEEILELMEKMRLAAQSLGITVREVDEDGNEVLPALAMPASTKIQ
jgi:hypothetical protein